MIKLDVIKNSMVLTHSANCYNILKMLYKHFCGEMFYKKR